jgi:hypothetical protein
LAYRNRFDDLEKKIEGLKIELIANEAFGSGLETFYSITDSYAISS